MNKKQFVCCVLAGILMFPVLLSAQNMFFGLNLGNSMFNWYRTETVGDYYYDYYGYEYYEIVGYQHIYIPKNISGSFYYGLPKGFVFKGTAGYGLTKYGGEFDQPRKTFTDHEGDVQEILKYHMEGNTKVSGFFVEAAFHYPMALGSDQRFCIYPGIGFGYYSYGFSGDWNGEEEEYEDNTIVTYTSTGNFSKAKLSGFAQFYVLGFEFKTSEKISLILEFAKLGMSMVTEKVDDDYVIRETSDHTSSEVFREKTGTYKQDYNAMGGFQDVSVTLGAKVALGKGKK